MKKKIFISCFPNSHRNAKF